MIKDLQLDIIETLKESGSRNDILMMLNNVMYRILKALQEEERDSDDEHYA